MQDDVVSPRTVAALFVGLAAVAVVVVGLVVVYVSPSSSTKSPSTVSNHAQGAGSDQPPTPGPASASSGLASWAPIATSVGEVLSDGTDLVAILTEPKPSAAQFEAACSGLTRLSVPKPPAGSNASQSSALRALAVDDAALVHDCQAAVIDAQSNPSKASPDGKNLGYDVETLKWDASKFFLAIGYSGSQPSKGAGLSEWTLAEDIGFQQSDFPAGTIAVQGLTGGPDEAAPVPPGPCSPVHSQPFVADYDSPTYDPSGIGNDFVSSEVLIMPPADASAALRGIGAPGYDTACFQPAFDANSRSMTPTPSCGSFQFLGSSISELPASGYPPGSVIDRYAATLSCTGDGSTNTWYTDMISEQAGSAFIQGVFNSFRTPLSSQIEQSAMNAMAVRANALGSAST